MYSYKAMTRDGMIRNGNLEANNEADLEKRLGNMKLDLIRAGVTTQRELAFVKHNIDRRDLILFCMQMAQLCRAGVPLLESLTDLRDSVETAEFKEVISSIIEVIEGGKSLSQALADFPHIFDTLFINLIKAGETSGQLAEVFESLTKMIKWQDELHTSTKKLLMSPLIVGTVVLGVTIFLMVYLVPQLIDFIANMGEELPFHTKALIATSDFMINFWYLWVIIPPALFVTLKILVKTNPDVRLRIDDIKLKMDYETLQKINPTIIYAHLTGFGDHTSRTAYDLVLQAEAGFMHMNGTNQSGPLKIPVACG